MSIAENGYNSAESLMVMPHKDKFIVLEGNRRLLALKLLRNPELAENSISKRNFGRLKAASVQFSIGADFKVPCVIFIDRAEAGPFIFSRHTGENKGVGLVNWNRKEIGRYKERLGSKPLDLQIVDFLKSRNDVSDDVKANLDKVPGTTLIRFANDTNVRREIGLKIANEKIETDKISDEATRVLAAAASRFATGQSNVNAVRNSTDRANFLKSIREEVDDSQKLGSDGKASRKNQPKRSRPTLKSSRDRHTVIPSDCHLNIPQARLNDIYVELAKINVYDFPNLSAVMIRVFLELSLDEYISNNVVWKDGKYNNRIALHAKLTAIKNHMRDSGLIDDDELLPITRAASGDNWLASKDTLHGFIHNRHYQPIPADILSIWNTLQNLFEKMWPLTPQAD